MLIYMVAELIYIHNNGFVFPSSTSWPAFCCHWIVCFLYDNHPDWLRWNFSIDLTQMAKYVQHFFAIYLLAICAFLKTVCSVHLPIYWLNFVFLIDDLSIYVYMYISFYILDINHLLGKLFGRDFFFLLCRLSLLIILVFFIYLCECFACMYICIPPVCLVLSEACIGSSDTGVRHGCEPLWSCWDFNLGPLQKQQVL